MKCSAASVLSVTAAIGLLLQPCLASADDAGAKSLQGVWRGIRFSSGQGEDPSKGVKLELTIKDNHVSAKRLPQGDIGEGDFKIAADGKTIDAVGATGGFKDKSFAGIFKVKGNTLNWCTTTSGNAGDRPAEFSADPAKKSYLIVVKRQQP